MQLINEVLADGIRCLSLPESRFKTNRLSIAMLLPLNRKTASAGALLPYLLRRSCAAYPDYTALQRRLNELYGASITAEVARIGEAQALVLTAASIDDRFALAGNRSRKAARICCVKCCLSRSWKTDSFVHPTWRRKNGV